MIVTMCLSLHIILIISSPHIPPHSYNFCVIKRQFVTLPQYHLFMVGTTNVASVVYVVKPCVHQLLHGLRLICRRLYCAILLTC